MSEPEIMPGRELAATTAPDGMVTLAHVIYGLHALAVVIGVTSGAVTVLGSFVGGLPSIVAVILNYVKRADVRGTWLDSHFSWQIRTFWYAAAWIVAFYVLFFTLVGIPLAFVVGIAATLWVVYRVGRGWLALNNRLTLPY